MHLSKKIKDARSKLGITQEEAAKRWGLPLPTLRKYEQDQRTPRGLALTALQAILDAALADSPLAAPKPKRKG